MCSIFFVCLYGLNFCLIGSALCGNGDLVRSYMKMFRTVPTNYVRHVFSIHLKQGFP